MSKEKHEAYRYMLGRKTIQTTLDKIPQQKQASFIYECISYASDYPQTSVPAVLETIYQLWQQHDRLQSL